MSFKPRFKYRESATVNDRNRQRVPGYSLLPISSNFHYNFRKKTFESVKREVFAAEHPSLHPFISSPARTFRALAAYSLVLRVESCRLAAWHRTEVPVAAVAAAAECGVLAQAQAVTAGLNEVSRTRAISASLSISHLHFAVAEIGCLSHVIKLCQSQSQTVVDCRINSSALVSCRQTVTVYHAAGCQRQSDMILSSSLKRLHPVRCWGKHSGHNRNTFPPKS